MHLFPPVQDSAGAVGDRAGAGCLWEGAVLLRLAVEIEICSSLALVDEVDRALGQENVLLIFCF